MKKVILIFIIKINVLFCQEKTKIVTSEPPPDYKNIEYNVPVNTYRDQKYDAIVKQIKKYLGFKSFPKTLGKSGYYFNFFEKKLHEYGLPIDFKYLPILESNLEPTAISKAGARGLWQFMPETGKRYGLYQNQNMYLFHDPVASTIAACKHLKYLYKLFRDWELVLAAYNCGEGRIQKIIKKTGFKTYWEIRKFLPKETQDYVPSFLAIRYIYKRYMNKTI